MNFAPLLAATETAPSAFSFQSILLGLFAVAIAYLFMAVASLRRRLAEIPPAAPAPRAVVTPPPAPQTAPINDELAPELLAVIAAAVRFTLGDARFRIVALSAADQQHTIQTSSWSAEGRRDVFLSHRLR